ncbi:recombination regulator RecX [Oceanobacillus massiliensis]|uniref:recombination regulator RecX n=1 Tax=Oceanobacillus massiliensis TaxID=1465765 RepID=UPI000287E600|nr:recombination regulator RecX [Oceanobacillus massiliensis]
MRKITRITTQVKHKNRFNIFLSTAKGEEYGFSVDEAILIEYRLRKGLELDDAMITTLVQKDTLHKSYTQAINFLSYRMRTKKEIIDYLSKKEVEEEHIEQIIKKLTNEKLIDDQQFANMFVRSRVNTSTKGPNLIKKELIDKGVSALLADAALKHYPLEKQYEKIKKLINKKILSGRSNDSFRKQTQQLQTNLMQKGFSQEVIKEAFIGIQEEKDEESEWDALVYQGEKLLRKHQTKQEGFVLKRKVTEGLYRKGFSFELINRFLDEQLKE